MKNEIKEAKKKIEMLTNNLLDSIDVDLLSDSQKIAYLKAIQPYIMPRLESVRQTNSFEIGDGLQWLIDEDEKLIESEIERKLGIGDFKNKGLA
jgi:hypothetical protein